MALLSRQEAKHPDQALDKKSMDMIFSAKVVQKKKIESQKVQKTAKAKAGGTNSAASVQPNVIAAAPEESQAPKITEKSSRALTSLRNSGLSALVGKNRKARQQARHYGRSNRCNGRY